MCSESLPALAGGPFTAGYTRKTLVLCWECSDNLFLLSALQDWLVPLICQWPSLLLCLLSWSFNNGHQPPFQSKLQLSSSFIYLIHCFQTSCTEERPTGSKSTNTWVSFSFAGSDVWEDMRMVPSDYPHRCQHTSSPSSPAGFVYFPKLHGPITTWFSKPNILEDIHMTL